MTLYTSTDALLERTPPPSAPVNYPEPVIVVVPFETDLLGAFDYGTHRYFVYRSGERGVWVTMQAWRSANERQPVGAIRHLVTGEQHAAFHPVTVGAEVVFDPDAPTAAVVAEVAAAIWSVHR
ncbi:hypothetical protein LO763_22020 [Glycomyces sp. A-F 0318]|uniref:hypothetical protein n=1 Tax=Glycomyces amatae TaxID=2881355 RepID=UPI001E3904C5|nr:hypothetical protein [Glycomyces amatae]MCD0446294.1 hypothetical protein [Glycomyces amatae]